MSPLIFIIFGATGDLMQRKLLPAIFQLFRDNKISQDVLIVGNGRRKLSNKEFVSLLGKFIKLKTDDEKADWKRFSERIEYVQGEFEDPTLYSSLVELLEGYDAKLGACIPRFFYLATPPNHYETILNHLKSSTLAEGCGQGSTNFTRVLIEKPFGRDLETAKRLDELVASIFEERQIYRIDHYLAKETIQNILAFRFANGMFEPTWNSEFIDHVQITVAETLGLEDRGNVYEGIGALRDVVQNHMMQMVSLVAMEKPVAFDAQSVRDARAATVQAIVPFTTESVKTSVVRGQYYSSSPEISSYRQEKGVDPESKTETFVAMRLFIHTPRWKDVPFYLRTGKRMTNQSTEISLHYKKPSLCFDDVCLFEPEKVNRNVLTIRIQPQEQIAVRLMVKKPGFGMNLSAVHLDFQYGKAFETERKLDAYEKLLLDAIAGDQMLFARTDEIEASWKVVTPILSAWSQDHENLLAYESGAFGPQEAMKLIEQDGRKWYLHEK